MAFLIVKSFTVHCCKLLLLFLLWNEIATVIGNGSDTPIPDKLNYQKVISEWVKRDLPAVDDATKLLPDENNNAENHDIGNPLHAFKIVKRAPSGFTGMRGKKEYEYTNDKIPNKQTIYGDKNDDWNNDPMQQTAYEYQLNTAYDGPFGGSEQRFKKAPSAFYGVRGKKYTNSDLQRINTLLQLLEEDNLRKEFLLYLVNHQQNDLSKRAPTGFTGMRGKRPSSGVIDYLYNGEEDMWPLSMGDEKRGPVTGFMGVRGKKDVNHQALKRSPSESTNRRNKFQRFVDFNNKFVAVRGKKANSVSDGDCDSKTYTNPFADETYHRYSFNNIPSMRDKRESYMPAETDKTSYNMALKSLHTLNN